MLDKEDVDKESQRHLGCRWMSRLHRNIGRLSRQ
jgi:hypothetical protein